MKYAVIWRKEGSLVTKYFESQDPSLAWEDFKASKPGGSVPVSGKLVENIEDIRVVNREGKCLALIIPMGA